MYCTVASLKRYLGISAATTTDDVLLAELIQSADGIIDRMTRRKFEAASDTTRYFDAVADVFGYELIFDEDICAITTVTNGDSVVVSSSEYVTMPRNQTPYFGIRILVSANKTWTYVTDRENAISVVGKWAYSSTPPHDIEQASRRLAAYLYRQKDNANDLDRAVVVGNATVLPTEIPGDVMAMIRPYIRRVP